MSLSPAATIVLTRAAERHDHRIDFDRMLPASGRQGITDSLLRAGLVVESGCHPSASSNAFASFRSVVSNPWVNQP